MGGVWGDEKEEGFSNDNASCNDGRDCRPAGGSSDVLLESGGVAIPLLLGACEQAGRYGRGPPNIVVGLTGEAEDILARAIEGCRWWKAAPSRCCCSNSP